VVEVKLSVVIITFNEERNIGRCLESVKDVADDVVVVDSYSTDKTAEICAQHDVRFEQHAFEGHIEQKNYAITRAHFPHVLSLDADEALSPELEASIKKAKHNWEADGYSMNRLTNYCGKWIHHCGWYPDRKLRLWDSRKGKWGGVNPHDCFLLDPKSKQLHLDGDLLHYSYYDYEQHLKQIEKFSDISARALWQKGIRPRWWHTLIHPPAKFIRNYFIHLGFMDGAAGWRICTTSARATWMKYSKLKKIKPTNKMM
jgi:glycosyltransferase involved in cell wall biosynthesis